MKDIPTVYILDGRGKEDNLKYLLAFMERRDAVAWGEENLSFYILKEMKVR